MKIVLNLSRWVRPNLLPQIKPIAKASPVEIYKTELKDEMP